MNRDSKIYIAGHSGMVGSAILRKFMAEGHTNIITRELDELDLTRQQNTEDFFARERPEFVIIAAARVGGIMANNTYRAEFIYQNLMIESNIIQAAHESGVEKLLFLGSSCIYPKLAPQPLKEEYLLSGYLEYTNEPYAIAKIAGIKLCESYYRQYKDDFISVMPTNLYGPKDNYNLETSHVLPALIRKFHLARLLGEGRFDDIKQDFLCYGNAELKTQNSKLTINISSSAADVLALLANFGIHSPTPDPRKVTVSLWGTGTPLREFLFVDDVADAVYYILKHVKADDLYEKGICQINIGMGEDLSIGELAVLVAAVVGFEGEVTFDATKPDGTPRKLMDVSRLHALGWRHKVELEEGVRRTYDLYTGPALTHRNAEGTNVEL
jgi:GDP-L-fucose synthase